MLSDLTWPLARFRLHFDICILQDLAYRVGCEASTSSTRGEAACCGGGCRGAADARTVRLRLGGKGRPIVAAAIASGGGSAGAGCADASQGSAILQIAGRNVCKVSTRTNSCRVQTQRRPCRRNGR